MKTPVIAIGIDTAEPLLMENQMSQGYLKSLSRLREQGAYTRLKNFDYHRTETPWTKFSTGCSPQKTGYWSPVKFDEATYGVNKIDAYDFVDYPPFYALGDDRLIRQEHYLKSNEARNLALPMIEETDYIVFIDNDVIVEKGWLKPLVECAE